MNEFTLTTTVDGDFSTVLSAVRTALADQGFGVITEIDMSATLKAKLGVQIAPQIILGACRPELAHRAIEANPSIAAMLPCNVVVRSEGPEVTAVEAFDPAFMARLVDSDAVHEVAQDAGDRLRAMFATISEVK